MSELEFAIVDWLAGSGEPLERNTLASLQITAGPKKEPVTEVEDKRARTVRSHINVPAYPLATWLLVNFWRLRWEPRREKASVGWLESHSMAAIDGAHPWPALEFASDGEFVQLRMQAEERPDVAAIRYLRDIRIDVPVDHFERAVTDLVDLVEARLQAVLPQERKFAQVREELAVELRDPVERVNNTLWALGGWDPGDPPEGWLSAAKELMRELGDLSASELIAVSPGMAEGLTDVGAVVSAMRESEHSISLQCRPAPRAVLPTEPPWLRAEEVARSYRKSLGVDSGPISNKKLGELLNAQIPFAPSSPPMASGLTGGYRNGNSAGRVSLLVRNARPDSQRFYLARVMGAALHLPSDQHVLPVSNAGTALQKFERAFAAEFLCPWDELDAFTDEHGTNDDGIAEAASHFEVSELLVHSSLVNKGKIHRNRLVRGI
jgi:Zn-dependent peptidase ImmA (M78 family)